MSQNNKSRKQRHRNKLPHNIHSILETCIKEDPKLEQFKAYLNYKEIDLEFSVVGFIEYWLKDQLDEATETNNELNNEVAALKNHLEVALKEIETLQNKVKNTSEDNSNIKQTTNSHHYNTDNEPNTITIVADINDKPPTKQRKTPLVPPQLLPIQTQRKIQTFDEITVIESQKS